MENRVKYLSFIVISTLLQTGNAAFAEETVKPAVTTPSAADTKPVEATPPATDAKPAAAPATDAKPTETTPPATDAKPADAAKPADTKPAATDAAKPSESTPPAANAKPTDAPKPADVSKTTDAKPTEATPPAQPEKVEKATSAILDPGATPEPPPPTLPHRPPSGASSDLPAGIENISKDDFVKIKPIDIPIIKDGDLQGYLGITVVWQGKDKAAAEEIKAAMPRLRDLIITDLHGALYLLWRPGFLPDKAFVMKRLKLSADKVLKPGTVVGVFTEDFYVKKKAGKDEKGI